MVRCPWAGFIIGACLATGLGAAPINIRFTGVDASAEPVQVSLVDAATQERGWVKVGARFSGCEVRAYDAQKQTLRLARGDETWDLRLDSAVIAKETVSDAERAEIERHVTNNLRQLDSASQQFYLEHGTSTVKFEQLVGTERDRYIKELRPIDAENYTKLDLEQATEPKEWVIVTRRGVEVRYKRQ